MKVRPRACAPESLALLLGPGMKVETLLLKHYLHVEPAVSNRGDWPFSEDFMALTRRVVES